MDKPLAITLWSLAGLVVLVIVFLIIFYLFKNRWLPKEKKEKLPPESDASNEIVEIIVEYYLLKQVTPTVIDKVLETLECDDNACESLTQQTINDLNDLEEDIEGVLKLENNSNNFMNILQMCLVYSDAKFQFYFPLREKTSKDHFRCLKCELSKQNSNFSRLQKSIEELGDKIGVLLADFEGFDSCAMKKRALQVANTISFYETLGPFDIKKHIPPVL